MGSATREIPRWKDLPYKVSPPLAPTDISDSRLALAMAEHLLTTQPDTPSEALKLLRQAFPHAPLTTRAAALTALMRRS